MEMNFFFYPGKGWDKPVEKYWFTVSTPVRYSIDHKLLWDLSSLSSIFRKLISTTYNLNLPDANSTLLLYLCKQTEVVHNSLW